MASRQVNDIQSLETASDTPKWALLSRSIFSGGLAGLLAGILFLGIGSRLAMRIVAILNPENAGTRTDAGEIVGAITVGGTVALVIFMGIFGGIFAGGIWVLVRERLPNSLSLRLPLAGVAATVIGSFALIDANNSDFRLFDPVGFNLVMFMMLVGLTGSATAYGDWTLQRRLPSSQAAGLLYAALETRTETPILPKSSFS